jgi:hypothetical protein
MNKVRAEFTPGPWSTKAPKNEGGCCLVRSEKTNEAVCDVWETVLIGTSGEANARLIASAPDLPDACRAIAALADGQGQRNMMEVAGQARAAIAKAGGRD